MGGDPDSATQNGWHVIHEAAGWGRIDCLKLLVERGANVSALNKNGWSALHFAAANGQIEMVNLLLEMGVDRHWRDNYGDTALDKVTRNWEAQYPVLPLGQNVSMGRSVHARKA